MIDNDTINRLKEILSEYDMEGITAVSVDGSACLPFIDDTNDVDIHAFINKAQFERRTDALREAKKAVRNEFPNVAIICHWDDRFTGGINRLDEMTDFRSQTCSLPSYVYQSHFAKIIYGEKKDIFGDIDILGKDKNDYLSNLKYEINCDGFKKQMKKTGRTKRLYHVLCGIYFIENGSYELTEEQKKNVNIAHDKTDGWEGLYEWAKEELEKLVG